MLKLVNLSFLSGFHNNENINREFLVYDLYYIEFQLILHHFYQNSVM